MTVSVDNILRLALRGLEMRQQAISNNIANADTPGYKAETVSFEARLREAMRSAPDAATMDQEAAPLVTADPGQVGRMDGNSVDLDHELVTMMGTSVHYNAVVQALSQRLALYRSVLTDGGGGG